MKKGVWKKHLEISAPGIKALCLEVTSESIWRAPSTDAEENEPFLYDPFFFFFFFFSLDKVLVAFWMQTLIWILIVTGKIF